MAPTFIKNLEPANASLNSEYSWNFELKSRPNAELKISKDNKEFKLNDRINIVNNGENNYSIVFKKVEAADIGTYKLVATNKCGTNSTQSTLSVSGGPTIIRKPNAEVVVAEKKAIKLEFEVGGIPLPDVEWYFY